MDIKLNYNHLFYFYIVAKLKGFSAAGKYLDLSQSALSTQIKSLETHLKFELVNRASKEFKLTMHGQYIFETAKNMFEHAINIQEINKPPLKKLRIGVSADVGRFFAVNIFAAALDSANETFCLEVVTLREWEVSEKASTYSIDFFISNLPTVISEAKIIQKIEVPVDFIVSYQLLDKHRSEDINIQNIYELLGQIPLGLMNENSRFRDETQRFLSRLGIFAEPMLEYDAFIFALQAVNSGLVSAFLPRHYSKLGLISHERIKIFTAPEGLWKHEIFFGVTTKMVNSAIAKHLLKILSKLELDLSFE